MSPATGILSSLELFLGLAIAHPSEARHAPPEPPRVIEMPWQNNDEFLGGGYVMNISVGTPPQIQLILQDSETGDIILHQNTDPVYLRRCAEQTPVETCTTCKSEATLLLTFKLLILLQSMKQRAVPWSTLETARTWKTMIPTH